MWIASCMDKANICYTPISIVLINLLCRKPTTKIKKPLSWNNIYFLPVCLQREMTLQEKIQFIILYYILHGRSLYLNAYNMHRLDGHYNLHCHFPHSIVTFTHINRDWNTEMSRPLRESKSLSSGHITKLCIIQHSCSSLERRHQFSTFVYIPFLSLCVEAHGSLNLIGVG